MSSYGWTEEDLARHMAKVRSSNSMQTKVQVTGWPIETPEPKPSKYRNRKTTVDGITFDSAKEAKRWQELRLRERAGEITGLTRQMPWTLEVNRQTVCTYVPDFSYCERGEVIVEDVKSEMTRKLPVYRLKKKLMQAIHGIEIREV